MRSGRIEDRFCLPISSSLVTDVCSLDTRVDEVDDAPFGDLCIEVCNLRSFKTLATCCLTRALDCIFFSVDYFDVALSPVSEKVTVSFQILPSFCFAKDPKKSSDQRT